MEPIQVTDSEKALWVLKKLGVDEGFIKFVAEARKEERCMVLLPHGHKERYPDLIKDWGCDRAPGHKGCHVYWWSEANKRHPVYVWGDASLAQEAAIRLLLND